MKVLGSRQRDEEDVLNNALVLLILMEELEEKLKIVPLQLQ